MSDNDGKQNTFRTFAHIIDLFRTSRGEKKSCFYQEVTPCKSKAGNLMAFLWSGIDLWISFAQECVTWIPTMCNVTEEERILLQSWALKNSGGPQHTQNSKVAFGNCQPSAQQSGRRMEDGDTWAVWYIQRQVQSCKYSAWGERQRARCCFWQNV